MANPNERPAAIAVKRPLSPVTFDGVEDATLLPLPSCPRSFAPQAQTDPSDFKARAWFQPPATCFTTAAAGTDAVLAHAVPRIATAAAATCRPVIGCLSFMRTWWTLGSLRED
jgi:hypothetical protein